MKKTLKGLAISLATICVLLIMAVPSFADNGMSGKGHGYYLIGDRTIPTYSTTDTVKVKVVVLSRKYSSSDSYFLNLSRTVSLTGQTAYTVRDVMMKFNTDSATVKAGDNNGNLLTSSDTWIYNFMYGTRHFKYMFWEHVDDMPYLQPIERVPVDGWMFRVNGYYPLKNLTGFNGGPEGALINDTKIVDGDVVYFYYNYPFEVNNVDNSALFIAADTKYTSGTLKVQLQYGHENHSNTLGQWEIDDYQDYAPGSSKTAFLYDSNFSYLGSISLNSSGYGTLSTTLSAGKYYIEVSGVRSFKSITGHTSQTGSATATCDFLATTSVYDQFIVS